MTAAPQTMTAHQYLYVPPGERGAVALTSPSGETVVLVLSVVDSVPQVMIATPEGQRIESAGWRMTALQSSSEQRGRR